ncbi:hypothetical protein NCS57_00684600 [Fusarium keratoplasticum]|uniref:Uncharacterized protein n=1 Tax=Fusarium keratoplasticum TaxID=1328300 RepID=A0ACC0QW95_9HYPO|nr:hypothetical protein NCS57_00684600 [Fusarium keratoplasticum]KAI8668723.1 hypothetical protein NCS57_00684600 [Fusarium keratoplasticum]
MWRLLPITLLRLASAFPTNWNGTTTCPQDALYTSLIGDGGEFCSSVLEGSHCGTGYSTPPEYMRYNQTQISSYCECILTDSSAVTTSANSSRETTGDITVTTADSASQTGSQSVSETQSEMGRPGGPFVISWGSNRKWYLRDGIQRVAISGNWFQERDDWICPVLLWWYPLGFNLGDNDGNTNSWFLESDSICCVLRRSFRSGRLKLDMDDDDWNTRANDLWLLEQYTVSLVIANYKCLLELNLACVVVFWGGDRRESLEYSNRRIDSNGAWHLERNTISFIFDQPSLDKTSTG